MFRVLTIEKIWFLEIAEDSSQSIITDKAEA